MIAVSNMPGQAFTDTPVSTPVQTRSQLKNVKYTPLHPTFGAEVTGLDFSDITEEKVREIKRALAVVSACQLYDIHTLSTVRSLGVSQNRT